MTYEEWLDVRTEYYKSIDYDDLGMIIASCGLALVIDQLALVDDSVNILQKRLGSQGTFSYEKNIANFDRLISSYPEHEVKLSKLKATLDAVCFQCDFPNKGKSLLQYNQSQGLYTAVTKEPAPSISVSVTGCEERCLATVYGKSSKLDEPKNLGCARWGKDKFFFESIPNWSLYDSLEIRIPYKDLTVETV